MTRCCTVELALAGTNYNLRTLIEAQVTVLSDAVFPFVGEELQLVSDVGNTAGKFVYVGDVTVDATQHGRKLAVGGILVVRASRVDLNDIYLRGDAVTLSVNVIVTAK